MADQIVRKGHPILAFFLGLLFGIILVVGAIAGGVYFGLTYNLDKIEANKDENGEYVFINANPDNGGVENILGLVEKIGELAGDTSSLTIGAVENLLPVAKSLTGSLIPALEEYVSIDEAELKATPLAELGTFLQDAIMDVRPSTLIEKFGGTLNDNKILKIFLNGPEADYVEDNNSAKYPVYYDTYTLNSSGNLYLRDSDRTHLQREHIKYLNDDGKLYFFDHGDYFYVTYFDGEKYIYTEGDENIYYVNTDSMKLTGSYYYSGSEKHEVVPVTIRALTDGSAIEALDNVKLSELLEKSDSSGGNYAALTDKVLGNITLGDLMSDGVNFDDIINELTIAELVDIDPTNTILVYIAYGVTGAFHGTDGEYHGTYKIDDNNTVQCTLVTEQGDKSLKVTEAYYFDGEEKVIIPATTVGEVGDTVSTLTSELAIADLLYVDVFGSDDYSSVMMFFAYSVTDVQPSRSLEYAYTGTYHPFDSDDEIPCYITVQDHDGKEVVGDVFIVEDGKEVSVERTKIVNVNSQISRMTKKMRLSDVMEIDETNKILVKLGNYPIGELSQAAKELTLDDFITVSVTSNAIITYVVYGVTDIAQEDGNYTGVYYDVDTGAKIPVLITEENGKIKSVQKEDGTAVTGTKVEEVEKRANGVTRDVTIGQLVNTDGNKLLQSIKDATITTLPDRIANLSINELYASEVYKTDDNTDPEIYLATSYVREYIYYVKEESGSYKLVNEGETNAGELTAEEFNQGTYYTYGAISPLWKILLYVGDENGENRREKVYSVNNISNMIENVTKNVQITTLRELHQSGVLVFSNPEDLENKKIGGKAIGDFTLKEFVFGMVGNLPNN